MPLRIHADRFALSLVSVNRGSRIDRYLNVANTLDDVLSEAFVATHLKPTYATLSTTARVRSGSGRSSTFGSSFFGASTFTFVFLSYVQVFTGAASSSGAPFFLRRFGRASWLFGQIRWIYPSFGTSTRYFASHFGHGCAISFWFEVKSHFG